MDINVIIFERNNIYYLALDSNAYMAKDQDIQFIAFKSIKEAGQIFAYSIASDKEDNKIGGLSCYQVFKSSIVDYENTENFREVLFNYRNTKEVAVQVFGNSEDYVVGMEIPNQEMGRSEWERGEHIEVRHINVSELIKEMDNDNDNCSSGGVGSSETLH